MDNILGIGLAELFFIAVIALIVLGPERLPGTLRQIAKYWGYLRNLGRELTSQFGEEFKALEDLNPRKILNEMADEELAKDLNIKNVVSAKKPTSKTPATPAKSTTTKPGGARNTAGATAKSSTTSKPTAKPSGNKPATPKSATPEQARPPSATNQILPPGTDEAGAGAATKTDDVPTSPTPEPAEPTPAEKPVVANTTAADVVGASDLAEHEG